MGKFSEILTFRKSTSSDGFVWGDFLFNVGAQIASLEKQSKKVTLFLILPVVDLAVPLIALGYLYTKIKHQKEMSLSVETFKRLPVGTPLIYNSSEASQHAVYDGITIIEDKTTRPFKKVECVRVRLKSVQKGRDSLLLMETKLNCLTIVSPEHAISECTLGRDSIGINKFTQSILGTINNMSEFVDCIWIVGKIAELEKEILETTLSSDKKSGVFNDLLRVARFIDDKEPSFTRLVSSFGSDNNYSNATLTAKLAIFREGTSYLKHRHNFATTSKIVVTEFSDRNANEAIETYNQTYYRRIDDLEFDLDKDLKNVVCTGFLEAA